ncbi:MAG TPA: topoisomerase II, partial [Actinobacteria bacterium]|nr:topoisomerase II [Actinomycetota bacterium]
MAKKKSGPKSGSAVNVSAAEVPVVGMREPCPCGSGRRYKA